MDADELFLGPQHKLLKKTNLFKYQEIGDNCQKCNVNEVDRLLSLKRLVLKQPRYERCVSLSEAEWDEDLKLAKVIKIAKNLTKNFSHSRDKSMYLYPEECLCLLEMKCLLLRWNERKLTIKNAFALLLQPGSGCTFEQFRTYGYLVKLGFRVFKYDNELKNNSYHPSDLTKIIDIHKKKKKIPKNVKKIENIVCTPSNKVIFPKLESTGRVILSTPSSCYLPHNLQPSYDTYSFIITVSPKSTKITEVIPFNETLNIKKELFFSNESIIYDLPQPTGNYPVYEKNILKSVKFDDIMYVPQIKKLKLMEIEQNSLPFTICMPSFNLSDERNLCSSKYGDNMEIEENSLSVTKNEATSASTSTSGNENNSCASNYEDSSSVNKVLKDIKDQETVANSTVNLNLSCTTKNCSNSELETALSNSVIEDEMINTKLNLPSHIKQKLFAIKPSLEHNEAVEKVNNVHSDVYYPDDDIPITSTSTSGNENNSCTSNYEDSSSVNKVLKYIKDQETVANSTVNLNLSCTTKNCSNSELETALSNSVIEDEMINTKLNLPSHIKQKLFAIKPSLEHYKSVEKVNNVHYDVYYPDNDVPKTSRPAPDFRVIVFEDDVNTFPNIYNVVNSSPNDNVPTLWAIVNSSSVSFYSVNNIILPKPTDWEEKIKDNLV